MIVLQASTYQDLHNGCFIYIETTLLMFFSAHTSLELIIVLLKHRPLLPFWTTTIKSLTEDDILVS